MTSTTKIHENLSLTNLDGEIWKDIPNYEGLYQASNLGRIKSLKRKYVIKTIILKQLEDTHGYLRVSLTGKTIQSHNIIYKTFKDYNIDLVIDHNDNIKTNNKIDNLKQISQRKNTSKDKKGYTSKYIGVSWSVKNSKWRSMIRIKRKQTHLGYFENEIDAHYTYVNKLNEIGGI